MNFKEIAVNRQSCRNYDPNKYIEDEKLQAILSCAALAPSACNSQPYNIFVCRNDKAKSAAKATQGMGMNKFTDNADVIIVISEGQYTTTAALGAKLKNNDYRSIDIGILSSYITAEATAQGLGSCILGWFDEKELQKICDTKDRIRLAISLGYANEDEILRNKKRKELNTFVKFID